MDKKGPSAEPHIQQRVERKKQRSPAPGIEEDVRRLKRDNFILVILVSILFGLVISLFIRYNQITNRIGIILESVELLWESADLLGESDSVFFDIVKELAEQLHILAA